MADLARIASPLTYLARDDVAFAWGDVPKIAGNQLQKRLQTPSVLAHFAEAATTALQNNASNVSLGSVLVQLYDDAERAIAYASIARSHTEANYSSAEKQYLALLLAVMKYRTCLCGRRFKIISDFLGIRWLTNLKDPSGRLMGWMRKLQGFNMTVIFKSGKSIPTPIACRRHR